ncbi:MAG: hypothetical protein WBB74_07650 [Gaiellaceae bacterium]
MPRKEWTAKQERKYEHIKQSERGHGRSTKRAKEIAARTVNKERAQKGQTKTGPRGRTKEQLYNEAKRRGISGRSRMTKQQLQRALDRRR